MASDLWNIFLNIVAAFIYSGMIWLWQRRKGRPSRTASAPVSREMRPVGDADSRARNRQALAEAGRQFVFYLLTFGLLYLSITMPPLFKALFAKTDVMLSEARFIGQYLPNTPIGKDYLQLSFFLFAAVLYWPLLALADVLTSLVAPIIDRAWPITPRLWAAIMMVFFMLLCLPVASASIWLFYERSFADSFATVLVACGIVFIIGQAQNGR